MNRDTVIALARKAGLERVVELRDDGTRTVELPHPDLLTRFAALVEQHLTYDSIHSCHPNCDKPACVAMRAAVLVEREECAKVCEARYMGDNNREDMEAKRCAAAIRSRT